jgi:polyvinyl alcohol dehydrogenase (cytochrome)
VTRNDVWNIRLPISGQNQDGDFGDSPKIYRLPNGRQVLALGQKTGAFWIFDAKTGDALARNELLPGGVLGGFQTGCAHAYGIHLTNGVNWPDLFADPNNPSTPPTAGAILALSSDRARELWRFEVPGSPFVSGVAVAAGVVYGVASGDGKLYALDTKTGHALATIALGPAVSGPSISRGHVYVGTGNQLLFSLPPSDVGTITSLGVDGP